MKKGLLTLLLLIITALPALAAPTNTSGPWGIDISTFTSLSSAKRSPVTAGKTMVITKVMNCNNLTIPADREIRFIKGGLINVAAGKVLTINAPPSAGLYQVFGGAGTVAGLKEVHPQWFGAVAGDNVSTAVKNANVIALNKAFTVIYGIGTMKISGRFETNSPLLWGSMVLNETTTSVIGDGSENNQIIGYGTGAVIDAVGSRHLSFQGFGISTPVTGALAECGLFLARSVGLAGDGSYSNFDKLIIRGTFTKAALITISSEVLRISDSQFWNFKAGDGSITAPSSYKSSPNNDTILATTAYGPVVAVTNTDIRFTNSQFWSYAKGQSTVWLEKSFNGSFVNCILIGGDVDATNKHLRIIANPFFNGKLSFANSHFEGGTDTSAVMTYIYADMVGSAGTQYKFTDVNFRDTAMVTSYPVAQPILIDYKYIADALMYNWSISGLSPTSANIDQTFKVAGFYGSDLHLGTMIASFYGNTMRSTVRAGSVVWNAGATTTQSTIFDITTGIMNYGNMPSSATNTPTTGYYTGDGAGRLVLNPAYLLNQVAVRGELAVVDGASSTGFAGLTPLPKKDALGLYDGTAWRPIGAYEGTPASATAPGLAGTVVYNAGFIYICTAANTWKRAAIAAW